MKSMLIASIITLFIIISACETAPRGPKFVDLDSMREFVLGPVDTLPMIVYNNEMKSLNDRCPVLKRRLNTRFAPLMVNDEAVAFC